MKERLAMMGITYPSLSQRVRSSLLEVNRSTLFYQETPDQDDQVEVMNHIQDIYAHHPFMGYRRITVMLHLRGYIINAKRTLRLMRLIGLQALYPKKNLSKRRLRDAVYPYLLTTEPAVLPNDVWCADITYLRMANGFVYLTALIDIISRRIMGWHISPYLEQIAV
jgi:putative transposase